MAVDPNNWKPQFNEREEQSTITPIPQTDGSIRYFLGNYDLLGTIDRIGMDEAGKYKKGVTPRAQIVDANGDDVDHAGACVPRDYEERICSPCSPPRGSHWIWFLRGDASVPGVPYRECC